MSRSRISGTSCRGYEFAGVRLVQLPKDIVDFKIKQDKAALHSHVAFSYRKMSFVYIMSISWDIIFIVYKPQL